MTIFRVTVLSIASVRQLDVTKKPTVQISLMRKTVRILMNLRLPKFNLIVQEKTFIFVPKVSDIFVNQRNVMVLLIVSTAKMRDQKTAALVSTIEIDRNTLTLVSFVSKRGN